MKKNKQKLVKEIFSIIGKELSKLDETMLRPDNMDETISFSIDITNISKDGFDLYWNHDGCEVGSRFIHNLTKKIRVEKGIYFDTASGCHEWNLDWSIEK